MSAQALIEKIRQLPPKRLAEVDDFVDFLRTREHERLLVQANTERQAQTAVHR